ncbi:MAG: hypothetical protein R3A51_17315 [Nannocystaceae bacterium]|nr:hypothetical protein [Myxococcales bacterium]
MQRSKITRTLLPSVFFAWTALAGATALAGEIKIGQDNELETSDKGALTPAGKKAAVTELDNVPGEDLWVAHIWAQLDRPAPGPLYIEFWQKINGQDAIAKRHEEADFEGDKFINIAVELEGNLGFNKDREYSIRIIQASAKGSDIVLARGKIKLIKSGRKPTADEGGGGDEEENVSEQDKLDSFAGGEQEKGDADAEPESGGDEAPPPVEPKKKGCSIDTTEHRWPGSALLLLGAAGLLYRRRR